MNAILAYQLFLDPLPIWNYWPWLLIPLATCVSIVYKSIKCKSMSTVPREAAGITLWIIGGMVFAGVVLWAIVEVVAHA